jgi:hypothetical protein
VLAFVGAAVAVGVGAYGSIHDPTGRSLVSLFFSGTINLKVWLATLAVGLAVLQLASALRMYEVLGRGRAADWVGIAHRISGTGAFLLSLPVAYHCLWALGFQSGAGPRVLIHSVAGCLFYGAFTAKVFAVREHGFPSWVLPVVGGAVFTAFVAVWLTSSLWFFTNVEFPGL